MEGWGHGAERQASDSGGRGACRRNASHSKQQQQNLENNPKRPQTNFQYFIIIVAIIQPFFAFLYTNPLIPDNSKKRRNIQKNQDNFVAFVNYISFFMF